MASITKRVLLTLKDDSAVFKDVHSMVFGGAPKNTMAKITGLEIAPRDPEFWYARPGLNVRIPFVWLQLQTDKVKVPSGRLFLNSDRVVASLKAVPSVFSHDATHDRTMAYIEGGKWFSYASRAPRVPVTSPLQLQAFYQDMNGTSENSQWVAWITYTLQEMTDLEAAQLGFGLVQ